MSANSMIVHADGVFFLSDTASYSIDGRLLGFVRKFRFSNHRWGFVARGPEVLLTEAECLLSEDLDTIVSVLPQWLRGMERVLTSSIGDTGPMSLMLGGWSERECRWIGFVITTDPRAGASQYRCEETAFAEAPAWLEKSGLNVNAAYDLIDQCGIQAFAVRAFNAQRADDFAEFVNGGWRRGAVGGEGHLSMVDWTGWRWKPVVRWPDKIGQRCIDRFSEATS